MDLERLSRTLKTRNIEFPREAMRDLGIRKIFNSVGTVDAEGGMDWKFRVDNELVSGERVLVERSMRARPGMEPLIIVSAIIFENELAMYMFVMSNQDVYMDSDYYQVRLN